MLNVGVVPTRHTQQVPYDEHPPASNTHRGWEGNAQLRHFFFFAVELKFQSCGGRRNVCVARIGFANEKFTGVVFASGAPAQPAR